MFEKRILNIYSVIIGIFFVISGIGKVIDTTAFSELISQYGFKYLSILSPLIVLVEILVGILLILLIKPKQNALFSFCLLIIFTFFYTYAHFKHGINDCGCFGTLQPTNISPMLTFTRNIVLILISFIVWIKYPKELIEIVRWKKYFIFSVMAVALFTSGYTFRVPSFINNNSGKNKYQDQNIKSTELSKYLKTDPNKKYLFFCFSYTCPHCWNSIENLRQYKKSNTVDSVVAFAREDYSNKLIFIHNFHPDFYIQDLPSAAMSKLTDIFPTAFYIAHDSIKVIIQSTLPSFVTFKKHYLLLNIK